MSVLNVGKNEKIDDCFVEKNIPIRDFSFKALSLSDKTPREGYIFKLQTKEKDRWFILSTGFADCGITQLINQIEVDPASIREWTHLQDYYCNKIYERDIVQITTCGGIVDTYLIWYNTEGSEFLVLSTQNMKFNGTDFWSENYMSLSDLAVMIQDPYGLIKDVKIVDDVESCVECKKVQNSFVPLNEKF